MAALSKASNDAAQCTAQFFQSLDANADTSKDILELATKLGVLGSSVKTINEQIPVLTADLAVTKKAPLKKKPVKDPNAPKKPLTLFFAYSATVRDKIRAERLDKGQPSLSSVELTQIISQQWNDLSDKLKEDWKKQYLDQLANYNEAFTKYQSDKANGSLTAEPPAIPVVVLTTEPVTSHKEEKSHDSGEKKKSKKRKTEEEKEEKEEKKKKKDKKKKKSSETSA